MDIDARIDETGRQPYTAREFPSAPGWWLVHGLYRPEAVLEKVYYKNAARLMPGAGVDM